MWRKMIRAPRPEGLARNLSIVVILAVVGAKSTWAQSRDVVEALERDSHEDRPWARGVPAARQDQARKVFAEANRSMRDGLFAQAAARYKETLAIWDHPGAYYNLGLAQLSLDQPIEAYESFGKALRFGPSPLMGQEKHDQAQRYRDVLAKQLARIEVVCEEEGAAVTLDGQLLFTAPGHHERMVRPGEHQLVASAPGRIPATEQIVLSPGEQGRYTLAPALPGAVDTERRWATWKPWAVVGAGAVAMVGAGYLDRRSSQAFDHFDDDFDTLCNEGCPETEVPTAFQDTLARAVFEQRLAQASYAVGGAVLATGAVLLYLNRERLTIRRGREQAARAPMVTPVLEPGHAGVRAVLYF